MASTVKNMDKVAWNITKVGGRPIIDCINYLLLRTDCHTFSRCNQCTFIMKQFLGSLSRVSQGCRNMLAGLHFHLEAQLGTSHLQPHLGNWQNPVSVAVWVKAQAFCWLSAGDCLQSQNPVHKAIKGMVPLLRVFILLSEVHPEYPHLGSIA